MRRRRTMKARSAVFDVKDEPGERERVLVANTTLLTWLVLVLL